MRHQEDEVGAEVEADSEVELEAGSAVVLES